MKTILLVLCNFFAVICLQAQVYEGISKPKSFNLQKKDEITVTNENKRGFKKLEENKKDQRGFVNSNQTNAAKIEALGKFYALIIGISDYDDEGVNDLDKPVKDGQKIYDVLANKYSFKKENMVFLKNAKRAEIITALDDLVTNVTENDNLIIFYAGHGIWDEKRLMGFWLPSDIDKANTANWISNSSFVDYLVGIKSKHTLLIVDACFGGAIFKNRRAFTDAPVGIDKIYALPSRNAMTSGTLTEVPDKSVFLEYLLKRLNDNTEKYLSAQDLFLQIRTPVLNNSATVPQFGEIKNTGDEGGDFIFIQE